MTGEPNHPRDAYSLRSEVVFGNGAGRRKDATMATKTMRMSYFTVIAHALTGGRAYAGDENSPAGFLKLTTTGRKTGQARTVELMYLRDGTRYVVAASNAGRQRNPGWYFNVQSTPQPTPMLFDVKRGLSLRRGDGASTRKAARPDLSS